MIISLLKAIEILEILGKENKKKYSVAELVQQTGFPPSTVHRILQTLAHKNIVSKDIDSHLYYLGPALIPLGKKASFHVNIRDAAMPVLRELSDETGEDSHLIILSGFKGLFLEKVEGKHPLKIVEIYGPEIDLHCGAMRKALLAFQGESFIDAYIKRGLKSYTDNTIIDPEQLKLHLQGIRQEGVAIAVEEYIVGGLGVGAPIRNKDGSVHASIGIIAPLSRAGEMGFDYYKKIIKKHAAKVSLQLGYSQTL